MIVVLLVVDIVAVVVAAVVVVVLTLRTLHCLPVPSCPGRDCDCSGFGFTSGAKKHATVLHTASLK